MIARYFIDRPITAAVSSLLLVLAGTVVMFRLPVAQYPDITPPTVQITASYPGASAETVAQSVAAPIEKELSGIRNLLYFQSFCTADGGMNLTVSFEIGTDLDIAAVEIQNRLTRATPTLPQETVRNGITVAKASSSLLMVASLNSTDPAHDSLFLGNYATINMVDTLRRVPGVGEAQVFGGGDYSMRIWLNPEVMAAKGITVTDVASAIREQNGVFAAGRLGGSPSEGEPSLTIPVITRGRLESPQQFENIIIRPNPDGSHLLLKDVARVELGALSYDTTGRQDGKPTTFILINLQPDGNALQAIDGTKKALNELAKSFPKGLSYEIPYDIAPFIEISIHEVVKTFIEAVLLVLLVVFVFLGTWRATLVPLVAVPVSIIGAFLGMYLLGFSINSLTLFGLVLAIGIVVDDAIIVVENVERILHTEDLSVRDAVVKAMQQVTGPVIASVLVMAAVFLPVAFLGGITGEMYRQFAVTIAISVAISGLVALSLSPALCRVLLKRKQTKLLPFRLFDRGFEAATSLYIWTTRLCLRLWPVTLLAFAGVMAATFFAFRSVPTAFIPQEDQGYIINAVLLPPGSSLQRTSAVLEDVEKFMMAQPEVENVVTLGGMDLFSGFAPSTNAGIMFCRLKTWDERPSPAQSADAVAGRTFMAFMGYKDAFVLSLNPPPVQGLGLRAGFEMQLQARSGQTVAELSGVLQQFLAAAGTSDKIQGLQGGLNVNTPQLFVDLNRTRAKAAGLPITDVFDSLQALLGSLYVNDFVKYGRIYRVQLQAEPRFRMNPDSITRFFVRNDAGVMVPLSGFLNMNFEAGPNMVSRFNAYPAAQITGEPKPGVSTGEAMAEITRLAEKHLPPGYGFEWSGASLQEIRAGNQAPYVIAFGLLVVFLVLAAQYESWTLPIAVLLAVPLGAFGAIQAIGLAGMPQDIYFQIGLLTLVGLAAKNAILIVEFGSALRKLGLPLVQATLEAARLRLRPIMMTSLTFILGVLPLVLSTGAGASGRRSIGTGVLGGMISATVLAVLFVPVFFLVIQGGVEWIARRLGQLTAEPLTSQPAPEEALAVVAAILGNSPPPASSHLPSHRGEEADPGADTQPSLPAQHDSKSAGQS